MEADPPIIVEPPVLEVPVTAAQLRRLEELVAALAEHGISASVGEITELLLSRELNQRGPDAIMQLAADMKVNEQVGE